MAEPLDLSGFPLQVGTVPAQEEPLQYVAGLVDTDGSINGSVGGLSLAVTQAEGCFTTVAFLYKTLGGSVTLHQHANKVRQSSYTWCISNPSDVVALLKAIAPFLTIKRAQAECASAFPTANTRVIPVEVVDADGNVQVYPSVKAAFKALGIWIRTVPATGSLKVVANGQTYTVRKTLDEAQVAAIRAERARIGETLKGLHKTEHAPLDHITELSWAYTAGVVDGDGCLKAIKKSSQAHEICSAHPALPELFKRLHKGVVYCDRRKKKAYVWQVSARQGAREFLANIAPYLNGKREQAALLLSMGPGEAQEVKRKLRLLKGKGVSRMPFEPLKFKLPPKMEAVGVQKLTSGRFQALIGAHGVQYSLGTFDTEREASAAYVHFRDIYEAEKRAGVRQFDWESVRAENIKAARIALGPPAVKKRYIYFIKETGAYQVKIGSLKYCETFPTEAQAVTQRDRVLADAAAKKGSVYVNADDVAAAAEAERLARGPAMEKQKYIYYLAQTCTYQARLNKRGVRMCKSYKTQEEAIAARDEFLAQHGLSL